MKKTALYARVSTSGQRRGGRSQRTRADCQNRKVLPLEAIVKGNCPLGGTSKK